MNTNEKTLHLSHKPMPPEWAIAKAEEIAAIMRETSDAEFSGHLKVLIAWALVQASQTHPLETAAANAQGFLERNLHSDLPKNCCGRYWGMHSALLALKTS